ncbi:hypothetical protein MLD38_036310 [Melastoma candidum]|uniref:Uncharacterized protein n=1 Tax=Melastoma candidum TaxID=119954 RepID=A0ACB9LK87_9MYRT|nr:hypothetical protein MLD38_036310 [Melastoma candidum]
MEGLVIKSLLQLVAVSIFLRQLGCDGKVMMEYIGATGAPVDFDSVPIKPGLDFYFLLSFAIDSDPSGKPQNGKFSRYWSSSLTPESVSSIKKKHPNVKLLASLSGWSIGDIELRWYDPKDTRQWISNAFSSLKSLVKEYGLDGIDVDYEIFPEGRNTSFAYCVGELIAMMKNQSVIKVATIAPYHKTADEYIELFKRYGGMIDYVNHQFYTDRVGSPRAYLDAFKLRASQFDRKKLLPSYEINGRGIQGDTFFDALGLIQRSGFEINGLMIYSADASLASKDFHYEVRSQEFLLNSTSTNKTAA